MINNNLYLPYLKKKENFINLRDKLRQQRFNHVHMKRVMELFEAIKELNPGDLKISAEKSILVSGSYNEKLREIIKEASELLIPWRTGPFNLLGLEIDSEWKSDMRWDRLKSFLPELENKIIADIGCGNGYFMFRMIQYNPKVIFGLDPQARCVLQFELINSLLQEKRLLVEPLGIENTDVFYNYFDFVLCMGVIYHRRDPHTCLTKVRESMKPGGTFIMESLVIPDKGPVSFSPPDRYMKMRNVWFVPSADCMCSWLEKTGFKDIKILLEYDVGTDEQRRTYYSPDESLADFLDPSDSSKTIEGFPLPKRAIISAIA